MPSLFNGQFKDSLIETFSRIKYGGTAPTSQKAFFINLQEIKGIKFGTRNPINYFDNFYNAELFLRAHGTYSIKISDPLKFYAEAVPRNAEHVEISQINEQYLNEFLEALQSSLNQMSVDGTRISYVASKGRELSKYMAQTLDDDWKQMRGIEVQSVGIASISYDEESQKLINKRNEGAMLSDPTIREGYVQGQIAQGINAAGSNPNGAAMGFMVVGMGMNAGGSFMAGASQANMQQQQQMMQQQMMQQQPMQQQPMQQPMQQQPMQAAPQAAAPANSWTCSCGAVNTGKFCTNCGSKAPEPASAEWTCSCGAVNTGKFCPNCGSQRP